MARAFPDPVGARLAQLHTMKSPHTSGDWRIGKRGGKAGVGAIYGPKGEEIAVFSGMLSPDEELENARLIAAAPELLDALRETRGTLELLAEEMRKRNLREEDFALQAISLIDSAIARATQP